MENLDVYSRKLINGLSVSFLKTNSRKATISAIVKGGSYFEPSEKVGISHILEHISSVNHNGFSSYIEYKRFLEDNYIQTFAFTARNYIFFKSIADVSKFRLAIDAIYRNLTFNNLNKETLDWGKESVLIEELGYLDHPVWRTSFEHDNLLWSGKYPNLSISSGGSPTTIQNITDEDIIRFKDIFFDARNINIVISGNLDFSKVSDYIVSKFEKAFLKNNNPPLFYDSVRFPLNIGNVTRVMSPQTLQLSHCSSIYFFEMPKVKSGTLFLEVYKRFLKNIISERLMWEKSLVYDFTASLDEIGRNIVIRFSWKTKSTKVEETIDIVDEMISGFPERRADFLKRLRSFKVSNDTSFWSQELSKLALYGYRLPKNVSKFFDENIIEEFLSWRSSLKMKKQTLIYSSESAR